MSNKTIKDICTLDIHVTYQDTDIAGVVYFANYFNYAEKGRSKILREILGKTKLDNAQNWAVKNVTCDYLSPAKIDENITLITTIIKLSVASVTFAHCFYVQGKNIANMTTQLVSIGENLKIAKVESSVIDKLKIIPTQNELKM